MDSLQGGEEVVEKSETGTPIRFVPLDRLYSSSSSTAPCVTGSSMSKKIKAQKLIQQQEHKTPPPSPFPSLSPPQQQQQQPLLSCSTTLRVYARRPKKHRHCSGKLSFLLKRFGSQRPQIPKSDTDAVLDPPLPPRPKSRNFELLSLGIDPNITIPLDCSTQSPRSRLRARPGNNNTSTGYGGSSSKKRKVSEDPHLRWVELSCKDADPTTLVGLTCKVYWPLDDDWYSGSVVSYNSKTLKHEVKYDDGDTESLNLSKEKIRFRLSPEQLEQCDLQKCVVLKKDIDFGEMVVLAATFDDCNELEPGIIIWAKLAGHPAWPAVVVDESGVGVRKQLKPSQGGGITTIAVQFFGSYDFARITMKQVISFLKGILASYHLKCRQACFIQSLEEAKMYLTQQKLPERMVLLQNGLEEEGGGISAGKGRKGGDKIEEDDKTCPLEFGDLRVVSLGNVVTDSEYFHNDQYIWPEGYAAERKFVSATDPRVNALYKMEVLRDPESISRPLFRITAENGDQFQGPSPAACWNQIYKKIRKMQSVTSNGLKWAEKSGSHMFGFSTPTVFKLIQELSYRPIRMDWKDLDKCSVCHMDEEYLNNLFMQCDKCRMMVHARCYGEVEAVNGVLWLCNLCRPGAPESPPTCCLCPVIGGAMKPTTNGLWAHLACAIWIPETCFLDIKRMEPIDGINRIHKDRWKLLCSICGVSYGACIQCSHRTCRVAYHPLCARAAGLCVELEDEDRLHLMSFDEDEEDQCINQLSFCKKHRQPSNNECSPGELTEIAPRCCSNYNPPINPSGCARTEPYDFLGRRGRKEPDVLAAVSLKRLYVENKPYLVTGYCQNQTIGNASSSDEFGLPESSSFENSKEATKNVLSMAEKYTCMKTTFRKRLAFGKSGIHGFGIFTKHPHRAGDMVIEYTGELVRPSIADRREHFIYNSLVGAGTYMFRIDDERVIDATRAGSIAHLINHSCEPNCYSRAIKVHGDEHIIIFAKRDISEWEELTYDYRFFSIDEQLPCYCGFQRCRGVVNDIEAEEHVAKLCVPRSKLIDWMSTF